VRVDEPRRDDQPIDIDHPGNVADIDRREVVDRKDPIPQDPDVRASPGCPSAIDDGAATEEEIEGGHALMMPPRTATSPTGRRPTSGPLLQSALRGAIAQLEEHLHGMQGVRGSSPRSSTRTWNRRPSPLADGGG
jgi:hypothetical protein